MEVFVSLQKPNGEYVYRDTKLENDMSFQIESYGTYRLRYYTKDDNGNQAEKIYTIAAKDAYAPTLLYNGKDSIMLSVGEQINYTSALSNVIVLDERDENPQVFVLVISPELSVETLTETGAVSTYTFERKGTYCLRYYAMDSYYNVTTKDVTIVVK